MPTLTHGSSRRDILELIRRGETITRRHLAERTGLSRSVVAQTVSELIAEGLVAEGAVSRSSGSARGRPSSVLRPVVRAGWVGAVDLGHRHVRVAIAGLDSGVAFERGIPLDVDHDAAAAFAMADDTLGDGLDHLGLSRRDLRALAIGVPFPVVKGTGVVRAPERLPTWNGVAPGEFLGAGTNCVVLVENDANLGAWGEYVAGAGRDTGSMLYIKAADGVGAGLVIDGAMFSGAHGIGGEMGHVQVDPAGVLCRCGRHGCLETVVSPTALRRRLASVEPNRGVGRGAGRFVVTAANRFVFVEAGRSIGRVIAQLCNFFDPGAVIIGGQVGAVGEPVIAGMRAAFAEYEQMSTVSDIVLRRSQLGVRAELVGAIDRAVQAAWIESALRG